MTSSVAVFKAAVCTSSIYMIKWRLKIWKKRKYGNKRTFFT